MSQIATFMGPTWGPPGANRTPINLAVRGIVLENKVSTTKISMHNSKGVLYTHQLVQPCKLTGGKFPSWNEANLTISMNTLVSGGLFAGTKYLVKCAYGLVVLHLVVVMFHPFLVGIHTTYLPIGLWVASLAPQLLFVCENVGESNLENYGQNHVAGPRGCLKNAHELLNLRALKILMLYENIYLSMYGKYILCGISNGTFEIPHNISYPYIERCRFYSQVKI